MSKITKQLFGGSTSSNQQTQDSRLDPRMFDMFNANQQRATGVADNLQARQFAGFTPDYYAGRDQIMSTVNGPGQRSLEAAQMGAARGMNFRAPTITGQGYNAVTGTSQGYNAATGTSRGYDAATGTSRGYDANTGQAALANRGDIRDVTGGSFLNANIGDYMNPFLNLVAGNTMADMDRARQMTQRQNADSASAARAFGGSRQGVLEAETNRGYFDRLGNTLGGLYATGFDAASNLAGQDLNRGMQAQLANQGIDQNIVGMNTGNQQQMNLANMGAQNDASRFGADAANNMSALNMGAQNQARMFGADAANNMSLANMAAQNQASMFGADAANNMSALNMNALNQAGQFGATAQNAASMANQQAALNANQQRLAASGLLGDLGLTGQQMALQRGEAIGNLGLAEQQLNQAQMDAIRNLPIEQQQIINQALGLNVGGGTGTVSTGQSSGSESSYKGIVPGLSGGFSALYPGGI
jgi:hypothetical protein